MIFKEQDALHEDHASVFGRSIRQIDEQSVRAELVGFSERDVKARPFKLLRTALARQMAEGECQIVGVTSASPGAGKSFIASNLAASMSRLANHDVILADLDLQRASIADLFGIEDNGGLTEVLSGAVPDIASIAQSIGDTGLVVLPSFVRPGNSAELIAGKAFAKLIQDLRDLPGKPTIICDLPPLFVSDDAILAAQELDGILFVVEQGVTTKKQVEASLQMLYPTRILGTVFNRYAGGLTDPYGYYGGYGSYYAERDQ